MSAPTTTNDDEMEAAPEPRSGSKRGRRRVTPPEFDDFIEGTQGDKSRCTQVKRFLMGRAMTALGDDTRYAYITGPDNVRMEILAELGRLDTDAKIREIASQICEHKIRVKDAVPMIRVWRNGGAAPGDANALSEELCRAIRNYQIRHPGTTEDQISQALHVAGIDY